MNYEIQQPEVVNWQEIQLNVDRVNQQLVILSVKNPAEDTYSQAVDTITALNLKAVEKLASLPLNQFDRQKPSFACAVIPEKDFLKATEIPVNYSWAKICSRSLRKKDREDLVVASSQYAESIDFDPNTPMEALKEEQVDILREIIHEHLPTLRDHYLQYPSSESLPISEAMDELVPRYIFGLQEHMPNSTDFLRSISQAGLLTVQQLWGDFSKYDSKPVSKNRAYGSAFLLGLGLIRRIEEVHEVKPESALSMWMDAIVEAETPESVVNRLASIGNVDQDEIWKEKSLQLSGQDFLTRYESK